MRIMPLLVESRSRLAPQPESDDDDDDDDDDEWVEDGRGSDQSLFSG
jgi:hypothetical protein